MIFLCVVDKCVTGIDLYNIMNQYHFNDLQDIYRLIGMFCQYNCHHGQVPAVLGIIFISVAVE
ncbi:hypothetical protein D9M68_992880 [compost metagenome]